MLSSPIWLYIYVLHLLIRHTRSEWHYE